jgi:hypothetical protein
MLNDEWVTDEIKEELKGFWKLMDIKTRLTRTYGTQQKLS